MKVYLVLLVFFLFELQNAIAIEFNKTLPSRRSRKPLLIEDFRFGGGVGYGLYITNQMDYQITTNFGEFKELIPSYFGAVYKAINQDFEMGLHYRNGHLLTLKSENTQGSTCDFDEAQFLVSYSLNHNAGLKKQPFTFNAQLGLGFTQFRSKYFTLDVPTKSIDKIFSSVGYNGEIITSKDQKEKQLAVIGNFGLLIGWRLNRTFSLYFENTINISTSNKMSGNLHKKSWIPPDSYYYTAIGLYITISPKRGQMGCPKF
ncbi:MAG: hypothetical protein SGJ00_01745 [bacterium]|nr:hypothetical protein [bacterium]